MEGLDLEVATEFLLIAATLVELKPVACCRGIPTWSSMRSSPCGRSATSAGPLGGVQDIQGCGPVAVGHADEAGRSFPRTAGLDERFADLAPDLLAGITAIDLRDAMVRALTPKPVPKVHLDHVAPSRLSVTEAVAELVDELPRIGRTTFRALTDAFVERLDVVVRFLAVLELYKQGMIDLDQPTTFGDLTISWLGGEVDDDERSVFADLVGRIDVYEG
jgi:segregation and condensation protein A